MEEWGGETLADDEKALLLLGAIGLDNVEEAGKWLAAGVPVLAMAGTGPLERACDWGAARCAAMLMDSGWDWRRAQEASGRSALESAAASGSEACARECLARSGPGDGELLGRALAVAAARPGRRGAAVAAAVLEGRSVDDFGQAAASMAMEAAVEAGDEELVGALLAAGWPAGIGVSRADLGPRIVVFSSGTVLKATMGRSLAQGGGEAASMPALAMACELGADGCALALAEAGADVGWRFRSGATMLMLAARSGSAADTTRPNVARRSMRRGWSALLPCRPAR